MMDTICVQCGDKGYPAALVYCVKCLAYAVHRYCLHVPMKSNEYVRWVCDDCEIKEQIDAVSKNIDGSSDFQTKKTTNMEVVKEELVFVDGLEQSYIAPTKVNGNEGSEQRDQIIFSHLRRGRSHIEPCPSLTEHLIATYDGSLRSSKKKETVFSSEANLEQESHGTTSTQPLNENNGIELDNYRSEYSTEGMGIGPSSENKESEVKQERSSPPHHTSDLLKDTSNHSNREPILREKQASFSHKSDEHVHIQDNSGRWNHNISSDSGNDRSFVGKESHINISNERSPYERLDKRGRQLDDAWEHAKPLDESRQKMECKYCGFVSVHGGISRLKAHLGGGSLSLPGCPNVPPEIKKFMADWYNNWVKNTKAPWAREIQEESASHGGKRGRPLDVAWKHSKPLGVAKQTAECKYCGFVCLRGGISRLKVHLSGGSMHVKGCSNVSPEVQEIMSAWVKKSTAYKMKKESQVASAQTHNRGRALDDSWQHAKPLDEARQKTMCNYCGFVSSYGGISRLKAHLGGGSSQIKLRGCPRVPIEVKTKTEQWFNEWSKNSSATWLRKKSSKRGRALDDAWEHAIPLDEMRQGSKCKYCGFVSKRGGINRMKEHLVGGDPSTLLGGCRNVPIEVKSWMSEGIFKRVKIE